ncbi:MAG: J domain-containing protein [Lachnospiraceae bacterium]|nr:J domain-containing protein [Butyrivibrio sp.]MCM1344776.1 J domain-containing protein [Muribaculaceae bacterium]MCM1411699.1 J domain-containing protein [Lachnospiraceae bacterium]
MFRTIWDWLEIDATRDREAIRKAYARQSKKYHPEEMPEEARLLREAYKQALSLADSAARGSTAAKNAGNDFAQRGGKGSDGGSDGRNEKRADTQKDTDAGYHYRQEEKGGGRRHEEKPADIGYHYGYQENKKTPKTPPQNEDIRYRYGHETSRRKTADESPGFDYYQFDADRAERLGQLEERLNGLYHDRNRNDLSLWAEAVKSCLTEEDLKDIHVVAAAISHLTQMPGMDDHIWYILEKELFRYCEKSAEWTWLRSQFAAIRRESGVPSKEDALFKQNIVIARQIDPRTGQTIPEKPAPKGHGYTKYIIIALVIIDFIITLILAYIFS